MVVTLKAFSLLEILIVIFIMSILLVGIASPSINFLSQRAEVQKLSAKLMQAINLARSEALINHKKTTLCQSNNLKDCSGAWSDGFIVREANKTLFAFQNNSKKGVLNWRSFPKNKKYLEFLPAGLLSEQNGTFWYCYKNKLNPSFAIVLNKAGRARLLMPDSQGKVYVSSEALAC